MSPEVVIALISAAALVIVAIINGKMGSAPTAKDEHDAVVDVMLDELVECRNERDRYRRQLGIL